MMTWHGIPLHPCRYTYYVYIYVFAIAKRAAMRKEKITTCGVSAAMKPLRMPLYREARLPPWLVTPSLV